MCRFCKDKGIDVAGVIKFSDGDLAVSRAYHEGGCRKTGKTATPCSWCPKTGMWSWWAEAATIPSWM
ncbi:MAG: hypothetical protein IJI20_02200 [Firmicutes bacterium]|nr:hypothetical protein [Bacillota bacterium]